MTLSEEAVDERGEEDDAGDEGDAAHDAPPAAHLRYWTPTQAQLARRGTTTNT